MTDPAAFPDDVHALVVGIETYAFGPRWTLPGPSDDALRFRAWLLERGVPDDNIRLHLAPEPGHAPDVPYRPCDRWALRRSLVQDLPAASSRLLWVFWGGHGYLDPQDHLRLLTADASERDALNIDVTDALAYYNSTGVPHHPEQVWIVDACATFQHEMNLGVAPPTETLPHGRPADRSRQLQFHAARRGQRTPNLPETRTGRFSSLVMRQLSRRHDATTPLDSGFIDAVERDARAADDGHAPGWTHLREPGRDIAFGSPASPGPPDPSPGPGDTVGALVNALCGRPWASDADTRQNLVDALPRPLREHVPRSRSPRSDLVGIVVHLSKVDGGLDALREAMRIIDGGSDGVP
ncbi:caspase family protein [Streptomyces sp. NPDC002580]|uniref:effector-associated domain 2-containing protein n=1 Tax=Streptomyces sp. NPDC002580 TaxID=3364653 RepID=UPI0036960DAC